MNVFLFKLLIVVNLSKIINVSDPYSFDPDPDPAFWLNSEYRSGSGSRVLMTKIEKNLQLKKNLFD
jgi:hypothetical protein